MKRGIILSVIIAAIIVTSSFSTAQAMVKESRDLKGFTKVNFGVPGTLYITFGPEFKVEMEGEKDFLDDIVTEVSGGKLVIKKENWRFSINEKVTVYITMPEITGLGVSGSGKAEIKDPVKAEDVDFNVSGSGKILTTDLTVADLNCSISGSGDIILGGGNATKANIGISGSGNYTGESLKIESLEIHVSGSGNCSCYVTKSINAGVSGSGNVSYLGNPPKVDAHVSGSGHVRSK